MLKDKIYIIAISVLVSVCVYQQIKIVSLQGDIIEQMNKARADTVNLNNEIERLNGVMENEQKKADATIANLRRRVANGVHVNGQSVSNSASVTDGKDGCRLSPDVANRLISIAERGDRAIRERNKCIEMYNKIRQ
jgi:hypothetical protein